MDMLLQQWTLVVYMMEQMTTQQPAVSNHDPLEHQQCQHAC